MSTQGNHRDRKLTTRRRPAALLAVGASIAVAMIAAHVAVADSAGVRVALQNWPGAAQALGSAGKASSLAAATGQRLSLPGKPAFTPLPPGPLALTARDYSMCPPSAAACVDLARRLTWLQSDGKVTFGPARTEPGLPGSAHATPRGTFSVLWKGGPNVVSNIYNEPMPWAVIFTTGGVAFHVGSLTAPSHGCAHLTMADAHYYNEHLAIGAEVVVF